MSVIDDLKGILGASAGLPNNDGSGRLKRDSKNGKTVGASMYGGPTDPSSGTRGYKGDTLTGTMAFAELDMGTALGDLPYRTKLRITNPKNGKSVIAEKLDIGAGGGPVQGHARRIDLWYETANAIGFGTGTGLVQIEKTDGQLIVPPVGGQAGVDAGLKAGAAIGGAWSGIIGFLSKLLNIKTILGILLLLVGLIRIAGVA